MSSVSSGIALAAAEAGVPRLSDYHLLSDLGRTAGIQGAWYAHRLKLIAELYRRPVMHSAIPEPGARRKTLSAEDLTVAEIAPKLHIGEDAARRLLSRAVTLTSRLPATMALLAAGQLDEDRANAIEDLVGKMAVWAYESVLSDDGSPRLAEHAATALAGMVENRILKRAPSQRTDLLRDSTRAAIARIAPAYAATLNRNVTAGRDVFVTHRGQEDQMGFLGAHLPIIEAKACFAELDARARALRDLGDLRTLDQLRADSLVQAILNPGPITQATTAYSRTTFFPASTPRTSGTDTTAANFTVKTDTPTTSTGSPDARTATNPTTTDPYAATTNRDPGTTSPHTPTTNRDPGTTRPHTATGPGAATDIRTATAETDTAVATPTGTARSATVDAPDGSDPDGSDIADSSKAGSRSWPIKDAARGVTAHVQVTVSLETLIGLRDDPGHLTGYGALTAEVARAVAFSPGSTWRRLITDPLSGTLLDYGRTRYKAPTALADHVIAREVTCCHPGCTRPAENCDLDHLLAFPLGVTCECNLRPRCRRHHRIKHETPWQVAISTDPDEPDGTVISTSPTGHSYRTQRPALTEPLPAKPEPPHAPAESTSTDLGPVDDSLPATTPEQLANEEPPF